MAVDENSAASKVGLDSKDEEITSLEHSLHEWRYILLHAARWLKWEEQRQPIIMATVITVFFLFLWFMEPSVLTTVSLLVMVICLVDYLGPTRFHSYLCPPTEWTAEHQRQYQQVCISLIWAKDSSVRGYQWLKNMRDDKPKQHFLLVISVLALIAFVGNLIPNLCLLYFIVLFLVLLPGLQHHGLLFRAYAATLQVIVDLIRRTKKND